MALTVNPLHPVFAAELIGADLTVTPSAELVETVERAMDQYAVVVLRDQRITDEEHIRFSRCFGPLELPPGSNIDMPRRMAREIFDASNLTMDTGELLPADHPKLTYNREAQEFHFDSFYCPYKIKWAFLLAHEIPPERGDTEFVDRRAAYERLSPEMKKRIEGLEVEFDAYEIQLRRNRIPEPSDELRASYPQPRRFPLAEPGPDGRMALCINPRMFISSIVGIDDPEEARDFMEELYKVAIDPAYVYAHKWRLGDMVIWDNRTVLHRGTDFDMANHRRDLRRTSINVSGPEVISLTVGPVARKKAA